MNVNVHVKGTAAARCSALEHDEPFNEMRAGSIRLRGNCVWGVEANVAGYLPFQFGERLLRNASMPSRKSSLI